MEWVGEEVRVTDIYQVWVKDIKIGSIVTF